MALLLLGCPKQAPTEVVPAGPTFPEGFAAVEPPGNFDELRPLASAVLADGSVVIAGSAARIVQYQWVLRVPAGGQAAQSTFDPGRVEWVEDNGTAGLSAVGVLGGVPEDKAWYGEIDAFGRLGTRQTYLSDGSGVLRAVVRLADGLAAGGEMLGADGRLRGWVVRTDHNGRELWKAQAGQSAGQGLAWLTDVGGTLVGAGWQAGEATDDAWVAVFDQVGAVVLDRAWPDPAWTRLNGGRPLGDGDLLVTGMSAPTEEASLDGAGSLWAARLSADGTSRWDRAERTDLSLVTRATPWGQGVAVAALRGAYGTDRTAMVATIAPDGTTRWTDAPVPPGVTWVEVHAVDGKLVLVAVIADRRGFAWRTVEVAGAAPP